MELVKSSGGEFTVWLDGELLAKKTLFGFPKEDEILASVKAKLAG